MFKNIKSKISNSQKGFTVVEVLVTSLIFSIIAMTVSSIFVQTLSLQRRASAAQRIQENALFVLESMSREVRVSVIANQDSPDCSRNTLTISHPIRGDIVYRMNNGAIEKSQGGGAFVAISGSDVRFSRFNFCVTGSLEDDDKTPKVAILTSVENVSGRETLVVNLQTTVSSRDQVSEFSFP